MSPVPVQTQVIGSFGGDHDQVGIVAMADIYSAGGISSNPGSINVRFDKNGRVRKVKGYSAQNSTAVTTDTGGADTVVRGLATYETSAGAQHVIGLFEGSSGGSTEYEIYSSTDLGATWSFEKDLGSKSSHYVWPDFQQWGSELFIATGEGTPQVYNGSAVANAGGTQSPQPSASAGSPGHPSGTYEFKLVSMIGNDRQLGSAVSTAVQLDSEQADLTWTADTDTDVTGYELYSTSGTGKEFYFAAYIDGRTTASYTFDMRDSDLTANRPLDEHGDAPPTDSHFVEAHKSRMFWARTDDNPRRVYWSSPFDPDSVGVNSFQDIEPSHFLGDAIVGMTGNVYDFLIVWLENQVWRVAGSGEITQDGVPDFRFEETNASTGTVSARSVVRVPAGAVTTDANGNKFSLPRSTLAYFTPHQTVNAFDGDSDIVISHAKHDFLNNPDSSNFYRANRSLVWAEHDRENSEITWYIPHNSISQSTSQIAGIDGGIVWNYRFGTWSVVDDRSFRAGTTVRSQDGNETTILLTGAASGEGNVTKGKVYHNKTGDSFDGTGNDITAEFWTKPLLGIDEGGNPLMHKKKRWRRAAILSLDRAPTDPTISVEWYTDWPNDFGSPTAFGSTTTTVAGSNITHEREQFLLKSSAGDYPHSYTLSMKIFDSADDADWAVEGIAISYQVLEGEKRGF